MKKRFLKKIRNLIKEQYPNYTEDKLDEILYGIEGLYLTIEKAIVIFTLALILGIFKEMLVLLLTFNFIRLFAFGMHANKSWICLLFSGSIFIGGTYISKYANIDGYLMYLLYAIALVIISIYAPADTLKRPLIKKKKRIRFKILSICVVLVYFIISLLIKDHLLINCLIIGLLIECILILPTTYKIFKMPYKNYKNYGLNT